MTDLSIQFERFTEQSILLQGSVEALRVFDPDQSKLISHRNRHLLRMTEDAHGNEKGPFFSFQYRTFRSLHSAQNGKSTLPNWVEEKVISGDIDDFLTAKMRPVEFIYLSERTAELADYLNNGLPGKGMGATSKAAQSFCESRIRTQSFLDIVIDHPRVFIPRSSSSLVGGCYLSLGTVSVTSWFEEATAHPHFTVSANNNDEQSMVGAPSISFSSDDGASENEMDWWRVLDIRLRVGIKVEVNQLATGDMSNPDTFFNTHLTTRKPSEGNITIIEGRVPSLNIRLKYREFMMLNLVASENIGKPIDESNWENIEKTYWEDEHDLFADVSDGRDGQQESSLMYAESARFVRFGEGKAARSKKGGVQFGYHIESISVILHR